MTIRNSLNNFPKMLQSIVCRGRLKKIFSQVLI